MADHEIERRMIDWPIDRRALYRRAIDFIKKANPNGVSPQRLTVLLGLSRQDTPDLMSVLMHKFADVVRFDLGRLHLRPVALDENDIDPQVLSAIHQQVDLTYGTVELMRQLTQQNGSFTENELAVRMARRFDISLTVARQFAARILLQFRTMLNSNGQSHALQEDPPTTRSQTMDLLRGLAEMKKKS